MQTNYKLDYSSLGFIEQDSKLSFRGENYIYESHNLAHVFSKSMTFEDFMQGLEPEELANFKINNYGIYDFLLGSDEPRKVKTKIFSHIPINVNFILKHKNRGKIESHNFFFRGICQTINPDF